MMLPSGFITRRFGSYWVIAVGVALPSLLTMLVPVAAENGVLTLATLRALTGAAEASIYPASYDVISRCFPTNECQ